MSCWSTERGTERTRVSEALSSMVVRCGVSAFVTADTYSSTDCLSRTNLLVEDADMSLARMAATSPLSEYTARETVDMLQMHASRPGRLHEE